MSKVYEGIYRLHYGCWCKYIYPYLCYKLVEPRGVTRRTTKTVGPYRGLPRFKTSQKRS